MRGCFDRMHNFEWITFALDVRALLLHNYDKLFRIFLKDHKLHEPYGLVQFCWTLKEFTRAYLFQIALEIMWLPLLTEP